MAMVEFKRPDGKSAQGWLSEPAGGGKAPGVVVIHEWWGLRDQIKGVADKLAQAGFRALAVDVYDGKITHDAGEAGELMNTLDGAGVTAQHIRGAVQHLKQQGGKVAVLGFCMGGALTLRAAMKVPELDAAVCFYGIPGPDAGDPATIKVPLLAHFANVDDWCTPARVDALEETLNKGGVKFELHRYDARHAFFNEARPEVHDAKASQLAWDRSIEFMKRTLG